MTKYRIRMFFKKYGTVISAMVITASFIYFMFVRSFINSYANTEMERAKTCLELSNTGSEASTLLRGVWLNRWDDDKVYMFAIRALEYQANPSVEGPQLIGTAYIPGKYFWNTPSCIMRTKDKYGDYAYDLMSTNVIPLFNDRLPLLDYARKLIRDVREREQKVERQYQAINEEHEEEMKKSNELLKKYEEAK